MRRARTTELLALGERLKAPMVHAMRGKEHVEWDNPYDVGMTGLHRLLVRLLRHDATAMSC